MKEPNLATPATIIAAIMESGGVTFSIDEYSLNRFIVGTKRRRLFGRKSPVFLPSISLVVPLNDLFDAADPDTGFPGTRVAPHPEKYLRVWADDLLTVAHTDAYTFVLNSTEPLEPEWLDLLFPPEPNPNFRPAMVPVHLSPDALPPARLHLPGELELATMPSAYFNVEDRR